METWIVSETALTNYPSTRRHIAEDFNFHNIFYLNLKPVAIQCLVVRITAILKCRPKTFNKSKYVTLQIPGECRGKYLLFTLAGYCVYLFMQINTCLLRAIPFSFPLRFKDSLSLWNPRFIVPDNRLNPSFSPSGNKVSRISVWLDEFLLSFFLTRSQNCEKRLLAPSCLSILPSVRLSAWNNSASTGRMFIKFDIWVLFDKLSKKLNSY